MVSTTRPQNPRARRQGESHIPCKRPALPLDHRCRVWSFPAADGGEAFGEAPGPPFGRASGCGRET
eukprot:4580601-Pyramimonas_sp.AAC.1